MEKLINFFIEYMDWWHNISEIQEMAETTVGILSTIASDPVRRNLEIVEVREWTLIHTLKLILKDKKGNIYEEEVEAYLEEIDEELYREVYQVLKMRYLEKK